MLAIGLMSGTSLDGIDAVLCEIDGVDFSTKVTQLDYLLHPYTSDLQSRLRTLCQDTQPNIRNLCSLNFELGSLFAQAVLELLKRNHLKSTDVAFIASHGQTIYHLPKPSEGEFKSTLQIGEAAVIAYQTGIQVISDFRVMDVAAKGEGAPLVPFSEHILYAQKDQCIGLQNLGGIGNITILKQDEVYAFDTGPGNMMIDDAMRIFFNQTYDDQGDTASKGSVNVDLLARLCAHPYLSIQPPKSTGREQFGPSYVKELMDEFNELNPFDFVATLTHFTAVCIATALKMGPYTLDKLIVGGGGAHNLSLMKSIRALLPNIEVLTQEELGFSSDAKEAIAFVVLGNQTLKNRPSNHIKATGAQRSVVLGKITPKPY